MAVAGLSLQEVADRLGVHYMTAYKYVRLGKLPATKQGSSWVVDENDVEVFSEKPAGSSTDFVGDLVTLLLRGDTPAAWLLVEQALASSMTAEQVVVDLLGPALRAIGDQWAEGEIDVSDEHLASAIVRRLLGRLSPSLGRRGNKRGKVLVAMARGEHHDIGAEMVAELLRAAHYEVLPLGADTPPASVVRAIERIDELDAVVIGATMDPSSAAEAVEAIRAAGLTIPVLVGGGAFGSDDDAFEVGADGFIAGPATAADALAAVLG